MSSRVVRASKICMRIVEIGWGDDSEVDGCGVVADEGGLGDEVYAPVVLSGRTGEVRDCREWHKDQSR